MGLLGHSSVQFSSVQLLSRVQLFVIPWTVAYQASPSMGFSRQEYWSVHNGVLLSHQKEYISISSNEVDETEANYTE